MALDRVFEAMVSEEDQKWRAALESEAEELRKKKHKLDNVAILGKFKNVLLRSNTVLMRFSESVIGKNSDAMFREELGELDEITNLHAVYEDRKRVHSKKVKELQEAQALHEELKGKVKRRGSSKKLRNKLLYALGGVLLIAFIDFLPINELILNNNATPTVALISSLVLVLGLDGGSAFLGSGISEYTDRTRIADSNGKVKPIVFMFVGGLMTVITAVALGYIRISDVNAAGGFDVQNNPGLYGQVLLLIAPYVTTIGSLGLGMWAYKSGEEKQAEIVTEIEAEERNAYASMTKAKNVFVNFLLSKWTKHSNEKIPDDYQLAMQIMRANITNQLPERLKILLPQILNEEKLITTFESSFKTILVNRDVVKDPKYWSCAEISSFAKDDDMGKAREKLRENLAKVSNDIIELVSNRKDGGNYARAY